MTNTLVDKKKKTYLKRDTERELIRLYQETGATEYLEQLLSAHTAYIQKIAAQQYQKFGKVVEYEDLIQQGRIGLIEAIKKFKLNHESVNPNDQKVVKNQALLTYAHSWILSEMQALFHRSNATHIPAHTLRAIQFNVKNPGCNTEERKALAKKAMRAESLDWFFNGESGSNENERRNARIGDDLINTDPTFETGVRHIFSPNVQKAINKLSDKEWKIVKMRLGLVEGEEGMVAKPPFIAEELGISVEEVEKSFKRAKRILSKALPKAEVKK